MPLSFLVFLQLLLYLAAGSRPAEFLANIFLAEIFTFSIAIWLGFSSNKWIDEATEQLLILRIKSDKAYYSIYVAFLFFISAIISLITILIPTIISLIDAGFFEHFGIIYFSQSFLLFLGSSFAGISLGALFHPRLMDSKSELPLSAAVVGLFSITRYPAVDHYELMRYVLWFFPNVSAHHSVISNSSYFTFPVVGGLFLINMLYGLVYSVVKVTLLSRKKS